MPTVEYKMGNEKRFELHDSIWLSSQKYLITIKFHAFQSFMSSMHIMSDHHFEMKCCYLLICVLGKQHKMTKTTTTITRQRPFKPGR